MNIILMSYTRSATGSVPTSCIQFLASNLFEQSKIFIPSASTGLQQPVTYLLTLLFKMNEEILSKKSAKNAILKFFRPFWTLRPRTWSCLQVSAFLSHSLPLPNKQQRRHWSRCLNVSESVPASFDCCWLWLRWMLLHVGTWRCYQLCSHFASIVVVCQPNIVNFLYDSGAYQCLNLYYFLSQQFMKITESEIDAAEKDSILRVLSILGVESPSDLLHVKETVSFPHIRLFHPSLI